MINEMTFGKTVETHGVEVTVHPFGLIWAATVEHGRHPYQDWDLMERCGLFWARGFTPEQALARLEKKMDRRDRWVKINASRTNHS